VALSDQVETREDPIWACNNPRQISRGSVRHAPPSHPQRPAGWRRLRCRHHKHAPTRRPGCRIPATEPTAPKKISSTGSGQARLLFLLFVFFTTCFTPVRRKERLVHQKLKLGLANCLRSVAENSSRQTFVRLFHSTHPLQPIPSLVLLVSVLSLAALTCVSSPKLRSSWGIWFFLGFESTEASNSWFELVRFGGFDGIFSIEFRLGSVQFESSFSLGFEAA
jgi:hypothetical protein